MPLHTLPHDLLAHIGNAVHPANRSALRLTSQSLRRGLQNIRVSNLEHIGAMLRHVQRERRLCVQITCALMFGPEQADHQFHRWGWGFASQRYYLSKMRFFPKANGRFIVKYLRQGTELGQEDRDVTFQQAIDLIAHHGCTPSVVQMYRLRYNPNRPNFTHTTTVGRAVYKRVLMVGG